MPSGMRNATPGPSGLGRGTAHGAGGSLSHGRSNVAKKKEGMERERERQNALKRPSSEDEEEREKKKAKVLDDDSGEDDAMNTRDGKEKRRRRKRKRRKSVSVVVASSGETSRSQEVMPTMDLILRPTETVANESHGLGTVEHEVEVEGTPDDEAPTLDISKKGKEKAKPSLQRTMNLGSSIASSSDTLATLESPDQSSEITRLKEQVAEQRKLLERHQSHLHQQQQSLTCQICLELMYRPYALTPCGHVTCYGCLVRWFMSDLNPQEPIDDDHQQEQQPQADNTNCDDITTLLNSASARRGKFVRRRKNCPVCRGVVLDRPVEMWDIKKMVTALARSHLVDLAVPPGGEEGHGASDPWLNVFKPVGLGRGHLPGGGNPLPLGDVDEEERERLGWYDHEDGGVYRCIDCFHEVWGGRCTGCHRIYLGHELDGDDDDDEADIFYDNEIRPGDREEDWDSYEEDDIFLGFLEDVYRAGAEGRALSVGGEIDVESVDGSIGGVEGLMERDVGGDEEEEEDSDRAGGWVRRRNLDANDLEEDERTSLDVSSDAGDTEEEVDRFPSPRPRRTRLQSVRTRIESDGSLSEDSAPSVRLEPGRAHLGPAPEEYFSEDSRDSTPLRLARRRAHLRAFDAVLSEDSRDSYPWPAPRRREVSDDSSDGDIDSEVDFEF